MNLPCKVLTTTTRTTSPPPPLNCFPYSHLSLRVSNIKRKHLTHTYTCQSDDFVPTHIYFPWISLSSPSFSSPLPSFSPSTRWLTHLLPLSLSLPLPRSPSLLIPLGFWSVGPNRTVHTFHKCQSHTKLTPRLYIDNMASRSGEGEIKRE